MIQMRVSNEPDEGGGITGAFGEMLRLQTDFHARLADETLRYLRRLQGAMGPAAPGTVVLPDEGVVVRATGRPGGTTTLRLEVENLQRVHCMITPHLTPLVGRTGATWFPEVTGSGSSTLVAPDSLHVLEVQLHLPDQLPDDVYAGALVLQGFRDGAVPVAIEVGTPPTGKPAREKGSTRAEPGGPGASKGADAARGRGRSDSAPDDGAAVAESDSASSKAGRDAKQAAGTAAKKPEKPAEAGAKKAGTRKRSTSRSVRPSGEGEP
jgi:hypothetical protein